VAGRGRGQECRAGDGTVTALARAPPEPGSHRGSCERRLCWKGSLLQQPEFVFSCEKGEKNPAHVLYCYYCCSLGPAAAALHGGPFLVCVQLGSGAWPLLLERRVTFAFLMGGCDLGWRRHGAVPVSPSLTRIPFMRRAEGRQRLQVEWLRQTLFRSQLQTFLLCTKGIRLVLRANSRCLEHTGLHKQVNCLPLAASQLLQGFIR